jgi:hypothetical protein
MFADFYLLVEMMACAGFMTYLFVVYHNDNCAPAEGKWCYTPFQWDQIPWTVYPTSAAAIAISTFLMKRFIMIGVDYAEVLCRHLMFIAAMYIMLIAAARDPGTMDSNYLPYE